MSATRRNRSYPGKPDNGERPRFTPRVLAVILIILAVFLGWTFFWLLYAERQALFHARRDALASQVDVALSFCRQLNAEATTGRVTRAVAIERARHTLAALRYGPQNTGYFYVLSTSGDLVVHPFRPELVDTNVSALTDDDGKGFVTQILSLLRTDTGGFTQHTYQWTGSARAVGPQIAYAERFEPWNWVIVTEAATADIHEQFVTGLYRQIGVLVILTLVLALVLSATLKRLVLAGVDRLIEVARRLQRGDLDARADINPTDEMSALAQAINKMAAGIKRHDEQIRQSTRAAMFALAKLAESRDNETGWHLLRVREYARVLAQALSKQPGWDGLINRQFLADIYDAVLLHDIGKVGVPDHILLKPEALDEGEMAVMMSHTLIGANTIRAARRQLKVQSSFLKMAEDIARNHHERWDGTGYVGSASGIEIPAAARIFTVADVYDALTTRRPYKPAYGHEQAMAIMRRERGARFDPEVFDTFIEISDEFDRVRQEFAEENGAPVPE